MLNLRATALPDGSVHKILVLRTAAMPEVRRAIAQLREAYPQAEFSVLGTHLEENEAFAGFEHFELSEAWLSPKSFRPLRKRVERAGFDLVVMCLNSETWAGYGRVSRVMASIPARFRFVAGYKGRWHPWNPKHFDEGNLLVRLAFRGVDLLTYPAVAAYLLLMPQRPRYMPAGQGRPTPGYER